MRRTDDASMSSLPVHGSATVEFARPCGGSRQWPRLHAPDLSRPSARHGCHSALIRIGPVKHGRAHDRCIQSQGKESRVNALEHLAKKPDVATWQRPEMHAALADRDVTKVFQLLQRVGYSQQRIAALTGQSQPEVSAIIHGRKVMAYDVLLRVADGLGVPRGLAGLSSCGCGEPRADQGAVAGSPVEDPAAAEAGRLGGAASEHGADGVGELAVMTAAGL